MRVLKPAVGLLSTWTVTVYIRCVASRTPVFSQFFTNWHKKISKLLPIDVGCSTFSECWDCFWQIKKHAWQLKITQYIKTAKNEPSSADSLFRKENAKLYIFYFEQHQVFIYTSHWVIQTHPHYAAWELSDKTRTNGRTDERTNERTMFKSSFRSGS